MAGPLRSQVSVARRSSERLGREMDLARRSASAEKEMGGEKRPGRGALGDQEEENCTLSGHTPRRDFAVLMR